MKYVIGIDGGGTKTKGYLANDRGEIIHKHTAGGSNYHAVGIENTRIALRETIVGLCKAEGIEINDISVISLGLAGLGRESDREVLRGILRDIGFKNELLLNTDAYTSLIGALGNKPGVVTICGTGSISMGIDSNGKTVRAGGWGHLISDEGSGYSIGLNCLKAVMRNYDGMESDTVLTREVMCHLNINSIEDIIKYLYDKNRQKSDIAAIAPLVFKAAEDGDEVANNIIDEAVQALANITIKVMEKICENNSKCVIALDGGIFTNVPIVRERFSRILSLGIRKIEIINPIYDGGIGACMVGLNKLNIKYLELRLMI